MQATKPRTASSLGMFDLLKGVGMLVIVFAHTAELYSFGSGALSLTGFGLFIYREALMAAFYIASGYGFRKRPIGKCVRQQISGLLKPYAFTALAATALHFAVHYYSFGYLPGTLGESLKVLGGFALGLPHTATYFGQEFFSCGPMWYLLALAVGWVLLDIIMNAFPEQYISWAVAACAILGWATTLVWELPFCISQGMAIVPYLYIGHIMKKRRAFEHGITRRGSLVLAACAAVVAAGAFASGSTDCISMGTWTMGALSIFLDGAVGCGILRLFVRLGRGQSAAVRAADTIGRRSLHIFCIHTVELTAIPWYLFAQKYSAHPVLGIILQYAISMASILAICELLVRRRELKQKLFPTGRRAKMRPAYERLTAKR